MPPQATLLRLQFVFLEQVLLKVKFSFHNIQHPYVLWRYNIPTEFDEYSFDKANLAPYIYTKEEQKGRCFSICLKWF